MRPALEQRHAFRRATNRRGMTLLEVLLVLGLLVIVAALLTPMLLGARERARAVMCQDQLRLIGTGFSVHADNDVLERFTTGAFDFIDDGCPDQFGWVSSLRTIEPQVSVLSETPATSLLLCPGNPLRGSRVLEDLLRADRSRLPPVDTDGVARWNVGVCNSTDGLLARQAGSPERVQAVRKLHDSGWNTNYAASWFLVRGTPALWLSERMGLNEGGQSLWQLSMKTHDVYVGCPGLSHRNCTTGPLTRRQVDNCDIPCSSIPLLGDAGAVPGDFRLSAQISWQLPAARQLAASYGQGPAAWNSATGNVEMFSAPSPVPAKSLVPPSYLKVGDMATESMHPQLSTKPALPLVLQDMRHWAALHRGRLQLLMCDGSVKELIDRNADGFINPGFPAQRRTGESRDETQRQTGYCDGLVEVNSFEVYTGALLHMDLLIKDLFEEF